ncbi:hypothetical protein IAT38_000108 [Cryptococcus sp. DSM 104549]
MPATAATNVHKDLPPTPSPAPVSRPNSAAIPIKKPPAATRVWADAPRPAPLVDSWKTSSGSDKADEKDEHVKDIAGRKTQLNPHSSSFTPSTLSESSFPDLSKLRVTDDEQAPAATAWSKEAAAKELQTTPKKKKEVYNFETPRRSASRTARSSSPTPGMSYTPFTPNTDYDSVATPITPFTPGYLAHHRYAAERDEGKGKVSGGKYKAMGVGGEDTPEGLGRYLLVTNVPHDTSEYDFRDMIQTIAEFKALIVKHLRNKGCIIIAFHDPRETYKVYHRLQAGPIALQPGGTQVELHCMRVDKEVVETTMGSGGPWDQVWRTSEAVLKVQISGGHPVTLEVMDRVMAAIGAVQRLDPVGHDGRTFIAEFFDTRDAAQAIALLDGQTAGQALLHVNYLSSNPFASAVPTLARTASGGLTLGSAAYVPGALGRTTSHTPRPESTSSSDLFGYSYSTGVSASSHSNLHTPSTSSYGRLRTDDVFSNRPPTSLQAERESADSARYHSPASGPWTPDAGSPAEYETPPHILALSRRLSEPGTVQGLVNRADIAARARQRQGLGGHWNVNDRKAIPEQNRVFPERIMSGLDSRTTVMIKDVPNKLSRQELVEIINEVVPGEFDFVYLRFDFKNCCNVGYAFVNFCSVKALYQFIQARVGKKWNMFSSEKVLQVSYADIQGKAALINKFRNSAVMGVIEPWRPQIFYSSGAMKGQPEPFPDSDNLAIRERSAAAQLSSFSASSTTPFGFQEQPYEYAASTYDAGF